MPPDTFVTGQSLCVALMKALSIQDDLSVTRITIDADCNGIALATIYKVLRKSECEKVTEAVKGIHVKIVEES